MLLSCVHIVKKVTTCSWKILYDSWVPNGHNGLSLEQRHEIPLKHCW